MKRSIKNIIMVLLIAVISGCLVFTISYAKSHGATNSNTPPDMGTNNSMNNGPAGNGGTPPSKPDDNNDLSSENDNQNSNSDMNQGDSNTDNNGSGSMPPDMDGGGGTPPDMNNGQASMNSTNSNISWVYYLIFGIDGLLIACLLMYLVMSGFNKKTFKEVFGNKDKVIIYVLSIIILTTGISYLSGNCSKESSSSSVNNMNQGSKLSYSADEEITEDTTITDGSYSSTKSDSNAILVSGDIDATISNVSVSKTGDSDGGDNTSFYGTNSAILAKDGANLVLDNITVNTDATGANGVFSYGGSATTNNSNSDGTTVTISNSKITTTKDNSGGIMTTGGGIMKASNLEINTAGTSSAAIRSDRGGGEVTVDGGTYTTTGQGSPTIYSTANISVKNATLTAKASEGIVIEGKNSVEIDNCTLTDTNNKLNGQSTTYKNIFLYQSMSGDASVGNSTFTAKNSKIITNKGDSFYITNTKAVINLENNTRTNNDNSGNFLRAKSDSWGNSDSNGGDVVLNMTKQRAIGNIVIDNISTLDITMKDNSYYEGIINGDNTAKEISLTLDSSSKIKLTGDCYVTSFSNSDSSNSNIDFNGYKLYVNGVSI